MALEKSDGSAKVENPKEFFVSSVILDLYGLKEGEIHTVKQDSRSKIAACIPIFGADQNKAYQGSLGITDPTIMPGDRVILVDATKRPIKKGKKGGHSPDTFANAA